MQQTSKLKQLRNNRIANLKLSLKVAPILHITTDRVNKLIETGQTLEQNQDKSSAQSVELDEDNIKIKSQNRNEFESKFRIGKKIGQGAHGVVRQCHHKQTGKIYALKMITFDDQSYYCLKRNFCNIQDLDHPNVIKYKALYLDSTKDTCLLVMQYFSFPNLSQFKIQSESIILGLEHVHKRNICHRDIKPENILYDRKQQRSILIDFGVSCKLVQRGTRKQMLTLTGTPYYRAPQMFNGGGYDERVDLWALGVLIYKLVTNVTPFQSQYHSDTINNILKGQVNFDNNLWGRYSNLAKDLVIHLLKPKQTRLSIDQAKNHFWFSNLKLQKDEEQMSKSAGFQCFFSLKRPTNNRSSIGMPNSSISPQLSALNTPMFNLQKYQLQQQTQKWLKSDDSSLDFIEHAGQEQSSPTLPKQKYTK